MKNWHWFLGVWVLIFVTLAGVLIWLENEPVANEPAEPAEFTIPRVDIELNGVDLETIKAGEKDTEYLGNRLLVNDELGVIEYDDVKIEGRGNSTWLLPKKPFQVKFASKADFLGLGKGKKWVFLANYYDQAYLRSVVSFEVAQMVGSDFAPRSRFVELSVNGEYEGLYQVVRRTAVGKNSVDLRDPAGVLVELDNLYGKKEIYYTTQSENCLVLKDIVEEQNIEVAMTDFLDSFNKMERATAARNYKAFAEVADVDSFVAYFLLSEFTADPDAYFTSQYYYKDGVTDKIHAGPGWDFDLSLGNENWFGGIDPTTEMVRWEEAMKGLEYDEETGETREREQYGRGSKMFFELMEMPEFRAKVVEEYNARLAGRWPEMKIMIEQYAGAIREAAMKDAGKWERGDYDAEVEKMLDWIQTRYEMLDKIYGKGGAAEKSVI